MKSLGRLGDRERAIVEERRRTGYRQERLTRFDARLEPHLRALVERLVPGVDADIDLAAFVDAHLENPIGRGDRAPGVPPVPELLLAGVQALAARGFAELTDEQQDALVRRMRRGEADEELGVPAKEFVDRLLVKVLVGYLAHPSTWERVGFNGPAYPEGYAWISSGAVAKRHDGFVGADRL